MAIEVVNRQRLAQIDPDAVAKLAYGTLATILELTPAGQLPPSLIPVAPDTLPERVGMTIAFVRDPLMKRLNKAYRGVNSATDVLSFPGRDVTGTTMPSLDLEEVAGAGDGGRYLGDVVISVDTAVRQAADAGHSLGEEVEELVIHGVLHLCGYNHETDRGEMNKLELRLRELIPVDAGKTVEFR